MDEILRCYHSNETSTAVLSCGYYIFYDVALTFESVDEILWCYVPVTSNTVDMRTSGKVLFTTCTSGQVVSTRHTEL